MSKSDLCLLNRLFKFTLTAVTICFSMESFVVAQENSVVLIPKSLPPDLSRDVTAELNRFFAGVPNGATVRFPAQAKYRIDGTIILDGKTNLTIEGNGVLFRAVDRGEDHGKQENYAGWKQTRNRAHFRISGGRNVLIRDIEIQGAHPDAGKAGTYDPNREAQHGFDLVGVENCTLEKVTVHDVYGDCVYMANLPPIIAPNSQVAKQVDASWPNVCTVETPQGLHEILNAGAYAWWTGESRP